MTEIQKQALLEGTQVAVYEIKEFLGSNQSEIIYRAWNAHLNGMVILKEFFPFKYAVREEGTQAVKTNLHENISVLEFGLGNFIQQNEKLLEAQFPGAQAVHNVIEFNKTAYLAVEQQKGSSLSEYLKKGETYTEEELRTLLDSLLGTLENFHEAGIVHGDIHPGNIQIQKSGKPVLLNFASARQKFSRLINDPASELRSGYGAPEQYLDEGSSEPPSDLYALGAVLYRCITGVDPEDARNRLSNLSEGKADPLKPILDKTDSGFSGEFLVTVDWMLQVDSKARPQTTSEISAALNKDKSNFKYIAASTPSKTESTPEQPVLTAASKGKRFGAATLVASVLASATLGSAVTWYLKQNGTPPESVLSEQQSEEGIAFGKAIERNQVTTAEEQIATPDVVAAAGKTPSSEDVSGAIAAIKSQVASEPALDSSLPTEEINKSENLTSSQQKVADEPVVDSEQEEKELDDTQEKNTEFQAEAPVETNVATQLPETSVEELEAIDQAEVEVDSTSSPKEAVADSQNEEPISAGSDDDSSNENVVESKETIPTTPETTLSIENTNTPLAESSADIPEIASQVETNNDTYSQELGSLTEEQVDSEQPEKETGGAIENQEVATSQVTESEEDRTVAQSVSPTIANTNAQSSEDLAKAPGADTASTVDSEKDAAPLPEISTNQSAENPSLQASVADKPVNQIGVENQAKVAEDGQAESITKAEIQNDSPDSGNAVAKEKLATSQESEQVVASVKEPLSDSPAKAPGADTDVEADPAAVSLLESPGEATSLLSEDSSASDLSGTDQATSDKPEKGVDIFIENPEKALEKIQSERALVQQYMAKAEENFALFKLTTPAEDNAHYYYKLVLEIDPQHEGAQKGSEEIFNKYVVLINKAIKDNKMDIAKAYLNRAKTIMPDSSSHQSVIEDLNNSLVQRSG
jgi:serine/threonine protein kinase